MTTKEALALLCAFFALSCGTARRGAPFVDERPVNDPVVRRGQIVFHRLCSPCHPGGTEGLAPAINNKPLPDIAIETQVRQGFGQMPAFSENDLSDRDLDAVVKYLDWLRDLEPHIENVD